MKALGNKISDSLERRFVFPLLFSGLLATCASAATAQTPGAFTPTGSMTTPRIFYTATLLADGRVLIAGGEILVNGARLATRSAELYNPATGAFTPTGYMTQARFITTATLLPDGKVLIAGGIGGDQTYLPTVPSATAELYDPHTGTFTATGDMTVARFGHVATLLADGKVLIAGGIDGDSYPDVCSREYMPDCAFAELYDPLTGTFTAAGVTLFRSLGNPHTATLLPDGRDFIFLGTTAELYDPHTATFTATSMTVGRGGPTATLLPDGKVLIAGGITLGFGVEPNPIAAELFDPATGTFAATGKMTTGQGAQTSTLLPDGTVLVVGGGSAEVYDPPAGGFRATGDTATGNCSPTATLLNDGNVLITGGVESNSSGCLPIVPNTAELYRPAALASPPALLSLSGDGQGLGAVQHGGTYQLVSPSNPATAGEALIIYCTGLADGSVIPPQVAIGGHLAEVLWFGKTPGFVGLYQINIRVPDGIASGPEVPVRVTYLGRTSNEVTIGLR
jgi:hypothetical protein